ncbi:MAG: lysophospholipid acyltransferase family protein [Myxococcota bacterium]|nr:lysophospholipid acyltransferase family protein [Myxococcota bacterium]
MNIPDGWDARASALLPSLAQGQLRRLGRESRLRPARALESWIRKNPLSDAVEREIVGEMELCWDGVPLPRALPEIIDSARRLLVEQLIGAQAAACEGPVATGRHVQVTSLVSIEEALATGRSVMLLTPSFGAWQAVAPALARRGYPVGLLDLRPDSRRPAHGFPAAPGLDLRQLPSSGYARSLVRYASEGGRILVAVGDEGCGSRWAEGALLGRSARVGSTPFELARRCKIPIIPVFAVREKGRTRLIVEAEIRISDTGRGDVDLDTTAARWLKLVDRYARRYPDHYLPFLLARRHSRATDALPLFADSNKEH